MQTRTKTDYPFIRRASGLLLAALLLAGCTQEFVSYDDNYVPRAPEDRFPIHVVNAPVKMNLDARSSGLSPQQVNDVVGFARQAQEGGATGVTIAYANGNSNARKAAAQAQALLAGQGMPAAAIEPLSDKGGSAMLTLSYEARIAKTKPCGDWSADLAGNQLNELSPNFGCTLQNNFAAMAANPDDLTQPRTLAPAIGMSRSTALKKYNAGQWSLKKQEFPDRTFIR